MLIKIDFESNIGFIGCKSPTDILVMNELSIIEDEDYKFSCGHPHPIWVIAGPMGKFVAIENFQEELKKNHENGSCQSN